jgi:hypothetical protein
MEIGGFCFCHVATGGFVIGCEIYVGTGNSSAERWYFVDVMLVLCEVHELSQLVS